MDFCRGRCSRRSWCLSRMLRHWLQSGQPMSILLNWRKRLREMYASLTDPHEYLIHDVRFHRTIALVRREAQSLSALMETITANLYSDTAVKQW